MSVSSDRKKLKKGGIVFPSFQPRFNLVPSIFVGKNDERKHDHNEVG